MSVDRVVTVVLVAGIAVQFGILIGIRLTLVAGDLYL